jgi:hypothetical protein
VRRTWLLLGTLFSCSRPSSSTTRDRSAGFVRELTRTAEENCQSPNYPLAQFELSLPRFVRNTESVCHDQSPISMRLGSLTALARSFADSFVSSNQRFKRLLESEVQDCRVPITARRGGRGSVVVEAMQVK